MTFEPWPSAAAWWHREARDGFEVAFFSVDDHGHLVRGTTSAVEEGDAWAVRYHLEIAADWTTRRAQITQHARSGERSTVLEHDGAGRWWVDGVPAPFLAGCLDVDLESSVVTNTLPVHRLGLAVSDHASAPAAYVRASDLAVERLDQDYLRLPDTTMGQRYRYQAPAFQVTCELQYDRRGLVTEYPGLAVRAR